MSILQGLRKSIGYRQQTGFTIIELLIVIIVVGILSTLSLNYLGSVQKNAIAARYLTTAQTIEKGMFAKAISDGITEWWDEPSLEACAGLYGSSPRIPGMVANCGFGDFVPGDLEGIGDFAYDSDADADDFVAGCAVDNGAGFIDVTKGVNILIRDTVTPEIFEVMDDTIDAGDGAFCGRMRYWEDRGNAYYSLDLAASDAAARF